MASERDTNDEGVTSRRGDSLGRRHFGGSRLGTYTVLGAATGLVPLPFLPDVAVRRIRGALVHDLTARHGLSVTPEARKILVEPSGAEGPRSYLSQGLKFGLGRVLGRLGPLSLLSPVRTAFGTFALGHLLERYLDTARASRSVRIDIEEAKRIRRAIDQAFIYAITTPARTSREDPPIPPEDLRDQTTQIIDGFVITVASAPSFVMRRLEAAFDETLASVRA